MNEPVVAVRVERPVEMVTAIPVAFACRGCKGELRGCGLDAACPGCGRRIRDDLPAGASLSFYTLNAVAAGYEARKTFLKLSAITLGMMFAVVAMTIAFFGVNPADWVLALVFPPLALFSMVRLWATCHRIYAGHCLVVGDDELLSRTPGGMDVRMRHGEATAIEERPGRCIYVYGHDRRHAVSALATLDGFSHLRASLLAWAPQRPYRSPLWNNVTVQLAAVLMGLGHLMSMSHRPGAAPEGMALVVGATAWIIRWAVRSRVLKRGAKLRLCVLIFAFALWTLWRGTSTLMGGVGG